MSASVLVLVLAVAQPSAASSHDAAARVRSEVQRHAPLLAHVVVALCDNAHQGIVPVPQQLGNGRDPGKNLYWGARYGVQGFFSRAPGWQRVRHGTALPQGVLERAIFLRRTTRDRIYVVADAWEGARIREAIASYLEIAAGRQRQRIETDSEPLEAGGGAHLVAFVGHNGLMDFPAPVVEEGSASPARGAIVLACASRPYFSSLLGRCRALPLLLTTGLMAPEAYSLEAGIRSWFETQDADRTRVAAAEAYDLYQRCGRRAARALFSAPSER